MPALRDGLFVFMACCDVQGDGVAWQTPGGRRGGEGAAIDGADEHDVDYAGVSRAGVSRLNSCGGSVPGG